MATIVRSRRLPLALASLTAVTFAFRDYERPVTVHDHGVEAEVPALADATNFLQASESTENTVSDVRFFLGERGEQDQQKPGKVVKPEASDFIQQAYWKDAMHILNEGGVSTPMPQAALVNAPAVPPTPLPWEKIMQDPSQPLDTKIGGAVMDGLLQHPTATPPPSQAATAYEFVAQCPMVLFSKNVSIRGGGCKDRNDGYGEWVDPNPSNPRRLLTWSPQDAGGVRFGIDSRLSGPGAALFASMRNVFTLSKYKFVLANCLGTDRFHVQEEVTKVDSMGHVASTIDTHDISTNGVAYFIKYLIKTPGEKLVAESNLFRMGSDQVNFTEVKDGISTGTLIAVAKRHNNWHGKGWEACTGHDVADAANAREWRIYFPQNKKNFDTIATVQDIRVAIATAITLMAYRDQDRGRDGLNNQGNSQQLFILLGGIAMVCICGVLCANCCMVFQASGLKAKLKRVFFESEGAFMPKRPHSHRAAPFHPTY